MKSITFLLLGLLIFGKMHAQKEIVYRVLAVQYNGPFLAQPFTVHTTTYGAPADLNVAGNVNDKGSFFYVYPVKDIDDIIAARDKTILELQKQVADLQTALAAIKKKLKLP